jgi:branched-chain amino acid transport system permease protein
VIIFFFLNRLFSDYGTWYLVGLGLLAILATTRFPKGLWGYVSARFDLHLFPVHCRLSRGDDPRSAKARA